MGDGGAVGISFDPSPDAAGGRQPALLPYAKRLFTSIPTLITSSVACPSHRDSQAALQPVPKHLHRGA